MQGSDREGDGGRGRRCRPGRTLAAGAAALAAVIAPGVRAAGAAQGGMPAPAALWRTVCVRGACFKAEVAVSASERERGLMFRDALPAGHGMLFVFPGEGLHAFWMKNTRIALDIVFIGAGMKIVDIAANVPPCRADPCPTYPPKAAAAYALEIGAGTAAARGLAVGDPVEFR